MSSSPAIFVVIYLWCCYQIRHNIRALVLRSRVRYRDQLLRQSLPVANSLHVKTYIFYIGKILLHFQRLEALPGTQPRNWTAQLPYRACNFLNCHTQSTLQEERDSIPWGIHILYPPLRGPRARWTLSSQNQRETSFMTKGPFDVANRLCVFKRSSQFRSNSLSEDGQMPPSKWFPCRQNIHQARSRSIFEELPSADEKQVPQSSALMLYLHLQLTRMH